MIKAKEALIAWNNFSGLTRRLEGPKGGIAVGKLLESGPRKDWTVFFQFTGGASFMNRRKMKKSDQETSVMMDYHMLVNSYGLCPYVVHRAFLRIEEYVSLIKEYGFGPASHEPNHDPEIPYGNTTGNYPEVRDEYHHGAYFVWRDDQQ